MMTVGENEMKKELMSEYIIFRVTPSEKIRIEGDAKDRNMDLSDYLRSQLERPREITSKDVDEIRKKMLYEINRIGNNINQIAHHYNAYGVDDIAYELVEYMKELKEIAISINKKLKGM